MANQILIDVDEKIPRFALEQLEELQGELKSLSEDNYEKLKSSIVKRGFFVPVFVWRNAKTGQTRILDGHQRLRVLRKLKGEGWTIPPVPTVGLNAKNEKDARDKLLAITSQYGKVDRQGLYEFLHISEIDEKLIVTDFALPDIEPLKFMDEFYNDGSFNIPAPPEAVVGDLRSVGGSGVKMLQLFYSEADHQKVIGLISTLQKKYNTENATDTVMRALEVEASRS